MKLNKRRKKEKLLLQEACPVCGKRKKLTRHHIFPRRWFGKKNNNDIYLLCRDCHRKLEKKIYRAERGGQLRLSREKYWKILSEFIKLGFIALIIYLLFF